MKIGMICSGNICRSPVAEYLLKRELGEGHEIYSAGTLQIYGEPAYKECILLAPKYNIDIKSHRSQGIRLKMILTSDLLITMTKNHRSTLVDIFHAPKEKVKLLSEYLPDDFEVKLPKLGICKKGEDIPDPMGQKKDIVQPVLDLIENAVFSLKEKILA